MAFNTHRLNTGATHSYFGKDEWSRFAPGIKRIEDALEIRRRILTAFERAEAASLEQDRNGLLTFLIVGGGPTGVELAGAIAELARFGLEKDFRAFDPAQARVILVQAAPRLLPSFPERLAQINRPQGGRSGFRDPKTVGCPCMVAVGNRAHRLYVGRQKPRCDVDQLVLGLP